MASLNFFSTLIVPRPTKYEEERQHNRQPVAKEVASGKDEIILSGLTKFFNVSLIAGHTYKTRGRVQRSERSPGGFSSL